MSRSILRAPPRSSSTRWTMYSDKQPPAWAAKGASDCSSGNATQLCDAAPDRNVVAALRLRRAPAIPGPPPSPQTHQSPHTNSTSCRRACTANTCPSKSHVGFLASAREAAQSIEHTHSRWCQEVDDSHCQGHCRDGHRSAQGQWTMRSRARDPRWTLHAGPASPTPLPTNRATATAGVWVGGWAGGQHCSEHDGIHRVLARPVPAPKATVEMDIARPPPCRTPLPTDQGAAQLRPGPPTEITADGQIRSRRTPIARAHRPTLLGLPAAGAAATASIGLAVLRTCQKCSRATDPWRRRSPPRDGGRVGSRGSASASATPAVTPCRRQRSSIRPPRYGRRRQFGQALTPRLSDLEADGRRWAGRRCAWCTTRPGPTSP